MVHEHRDRVYMRKDILLKLAEYGELNQSQLMAYCGLNNIKHREVVDELVKKGFISRFEEQWGSRKVIKYKVSDKGEKLARDILEPYEMLFPRKKDRRRKND